MPVWLIAFEAVIAALPTVISAIEALVKEIKATNVAPTVSHIAALNNLQNAHAQLLSAARSILPTS